MVLPATGAESEAVGVHTGMPDPVLVGEHIAVGIAGGP